MCYICNIKQCDWGLYKQVSQPPSPTSFGRKTTILLNKFWKTKYFRTKLLFSLEFASDIFLFSLLQKERDCEGENWRFKSWPHLSVSCWELHQYICLLAITSNLIISILNNLYTYSIADSIIFYSLFILLIVKQFKQNIIVLL